MNIDRRQFLAGSAAAGLVAVGGRSLGYSLFRPSRADSIQVSGSTPLADGFRMPAEFEPHEAIWLVWPEHPSWRLGGKPAEPVIAELANLIAADIPVRLGVTPGEAARVRSLVSNAVQVVEIEAGSGWIRDDGPTFLINDDGDRRGVDWMFNDWGYPEESFYEQSGPNPVAARLLEHESANRYRAPLVLEGGSIHSDGRGTILTTEECLLNPNRNPNLNKEQIENLLKDYLGAKKVIWLPEGVFKDSTSGHVDNMASFVRPSEVLLTWTDDQSDGQYERSQRALEVLEASTDADGNQFTVHKLHQPGPLHLTDQEITSLIGSQFEDWELAETRIPGSYVNYVLTNNRVIFPLLDSNTDAGATETFKRAFPQHEIIGLESREIMVHGGDLHCISQNLPARVTA